jgi:branched-subunit amino acid aminotransferase/4-amino-4-deoxychorismate lyase
VGAPPEFELLETMRWRPGEGIALLDLHLERLAASAEYFGFQTKDKAKNTTEEEGEKL